MNEYIRYIFEQNVLKSSSKQFNTYVKQQLLQLKPVDFTKMYKHITTSPILFNQLNLLMAKNVIKYSPANCTIQLSLPNVMVYQRMEKLIRFANKSLDKHVGVFVREWIEQGLQNGMGFPVMFDKLLISKVFMNSQPVELSVMSLQQQKKKGKLTVNKGKITQTSHLHQQKKQVQQTYNYHRLVYEYKSTQKSQQKEEKHNNIEQHFEPQVEVVVQQKKHKSTTKNSKKTINKQSQTHQQQHHQKTQIKQQPQYQQYMLNIQQLTRLYQSQKAVNLLNSRLSQKQKRMSLFQFIQLKDRQQIMQQLRWQKQQQYLAQILGANCLLVFNLIRKYPYITQKQLIKLTLMQVLQTREGLNQLVQKGLVYFYYENSRSIVYKVGDSSVMYKGMVDSIAKTIMNLSLVGERISQLSMCSIGGSSVQINKQKLIQLQCEMQRLDDILVLFGY